ncbi:MAG TPA: sigma-70 family RNA polymerase sigma factor [Planctomycetota bacterium]|nr:sigma-70 family RNA polymerase sigma factor [Planctomycetota bacterium]
MTSPNIAQPGERLADLLSRHEKPLVAFAKRILLHDEEAARDAVQETFLRYLRDADAGKLDRPEAWLYRVCRNVALDRVRKEKRMSTLTETTAAQTPSPHRAPEALLLDQEKSRAIIAAMGTLPDSQQEILRLKFLAGLSYREIAEVTGLSGGNVGFLIHQSLRALRTAMAPYSKPEVRT